MARASNIYLIKDRGNVVAAFTVKHEMETFLETYVDQSSDCIEITRLRDGGEGEEVDLTREYYDE